MSLSLSPELERQITEKVESGEYDSVEDVVTDAMALLNQRMDEDEERLDALRAEIDAGFAELDRGEGIPGPVAVKQAKAEFRRLTGRAP